jgi:formylglycine-generating enzyme required for sulfatase activity
MKPVFRGLAALAVCAGGLSAWADVFHMGPDLKSLESVAVGNPGNAGEWSGTAAGGYGEDRVAGAVDYAYSIGKFEVTAAQYTVFLNAVAKTDPYGLYNLNMWSSPYASGIERDEPDGDYSYKVALAWANRPVNFVSWGDAARFANWLTNGQPIGAQVSSTTEDGSYYLNGAQTKAELLAVTRKPGAEWVIPNEDEWYKAAYHKNDGVTDHYWDYATSSDILPSNVLTDPDQGNSANYSFTIGDPYYRTPVGAFERSASPYGTFDQTGNVLEWTEAVMYSSYRGLRGGSFYNYYGNLLAAGRDSNDPALEDINVGFRVALVPEPGTIGLLALAGAGLLRRRRSAAGSLGPAAR